MTDETTMNEGRLSSLETRASQLENLFSTGISRIEQAIASNDAKHSAEINKLARAIDEKTKPPTGVLLQILTICLGVAGIAGSMTAWRISHLEQSNLRQHDDIEARFLKLEGDVDEHHGDGHPQVQNEKIQNNASLIALHNDRVTAELAERSKWMMQHEATVSRVNARQDEMTKRNAADLEDLKQWQRSRQSGSDISNTRQAERLRALERAVFGTSSND